MNIVKLSPGNIGDYEKLSSCDFAENIGRICYRGLIAYDDTKALGILVWKLVSLEKGQLGEEIVMFDADTEDAARMLLVAHEHQALDEDITHSFIEMDEIPDFIKNLLEKEGFIFRKAESRDILVSIKEIGAAKIPEIEIPSEVVSLRSLSEGGYWNAVSLCVYHHKMGLVEDLEYLDMDFFEPDLSCCKCTEKWITGVFLFHQNPSGIIMPELFFGGKHYKKVLPYLMLYARNAALKKYDDETKILIRRHNDLTKELTSYLFPKKRGREVIVGERDINRFL